MQAKMPIHRLGHQYLLTGNMYLSLTFCPEQIIISQILQNIREDRSYFFVLHHYPDSTLDAAAF
jgi:hypothetical protein